MSCLSEPKKAQLVSIMGQLHSQKVLLDNLASTTPSLSEDIDGEACELENIIMNLESVLYPSTKERGMYWKLYNKKIKCIPVKPTQVKKKTTSSQGTKKKKKSPPKKKGSPKRYIKKKGSKKTKTSGKKTKTMKCSSRGCSLRSKKVTK